MTAKQIQKQYELFRNNVNELFPDRKIQLNEMYDYFEDRIVTLPASGVEHYHNAFPGGYIDHVLRVAEFSVQEYELWEKSGLKVDNFTLNELLFAAYHHDLGKVGMVGDYNPYEVNTSKWHRENQGKLYVHDPRQPFMLIPDLGLFTLQQFKVRMSYNEYIAIRTHDGVYDRANEAYYFNSSIDSKARTNIYQILHNADARAARFEFERWANQNPSKFYFYSAAPTPKVEETKPEINFDDIFEGLI